ncbi:hypothetical protein [Nocardia tengchongensis]
MTTKAEIISMIRDDWAKQSANTELDLALGTMVRFAAKTEFELQGTIRLLVGGEYASLVTSGMQASSMIDAIKRILDVGAVDPAQADELINVIGLCRTAFRERNKYVHGMRLAATENAIVLTNNRRNGLFDHHVMDPEIILDLAADFVTLAQTLSDWSFKVFYRDEDDEEQPA